MRVGIIFIFCLSLLSCIKEEGHSNFFQGLDAPSYFPAPNYTFEKLAPTQEGFELGRKLFYDSFLSKDGTISCASCHHQNNAFSDAGKSFSKGINGKMGKRNSPAMFNIAFQPNFMADGGVTHLEIMPLAPLTDSLEMGITMLDLINKLNQHAEYPSLFKKVFRKTPIDDQQLFLALAQFMGKMISANSKYDAYLKGTGNFTAEEKSGLNLFRLHCESCHREPLMSDFSFQNNLHQSKTGDIGRERVSNDIADKGKFKVPSLRNITLTAPYFHDGSAQNLEAVVMHYQQNLLSQKGINLSSEEQNQIISFLKTLSDFNFTSDVRFTQP